MGMGLNYTLSDSKLDLNIPRQGSQYKRLTQLSHKLWPCRGIRTQFNHLQAHQNFHQAIFCILLQNLLQYSHSTSYSRQLKRQPLVLKNLKQCGNSLHRLPQGTSPCRAYSQ
ncbi:hypothetical protein FGO68_gene12882 [Halteria grandinella]|uniref:Uncharacterized protein n=1 Tax=Halteria grandinella TaxID=5974 RepID=A0A8J8SUD6_HALGN|nr:hypothetical protein FGO68_gene12882 [Halteria grandinella]